MLKVQKSTKEKIEEGFTWTLVIAIMTGAIILMKRHQEKINIINTENERKEQVEEKQKERKLIEKAMPTGKIICSSSRDGKIFLQISSEDDNLNASFRGSKNGVLIVDYVDHGTPKHLEEKGANCTFSFIKPQTP